MTGGCYALLRGGAFRLPAAADRQAGGRRAARASRTAVAALTGLLVLTALRPAAAAPGPDGGWGAQWSPDGKHIAFCSQHGGGPANAWVMAQDGSRPRSLTTRGARALRWAAGSRAVYVLTWLGSKLVWASAPIGGGALRPAWPWLADEALDPTPSPDGAYLAYLMPTATSQDLWVARADGRQRRNVVPQFRARRPTWSPDGRRLAFEMATSPDPSQSQVWVYDRETHKLAHMKAKGTALHAWSADGKSLAFSLAMPPSSYLLGVCDVATGTAAPAGKIVHTGEGVAWSPNGQTLAVTTRQGPTSQVCLVRRNGTVVRRIGDARLIARFAQWSPDGRWMLFEAQYKGKSYSSEVWIARSDGTGARPLMHSAAADWAVCPSPDGKRVAFLSTRGHECAVWVAQPSGAGARRLAGADRDSRLVWSPDSRSLLVLRRDQSVVVRLAGTPVVTALPIRPALPFASWHPGSGKLLYTAQDGQRAALSVYDLAARKATPAIQRVPGRAPGDLYGAWDPRGRHLAFVRGREVWLSRADGAGARALAPLSRTEDIEVSGMAWSPRGDQLLVSLIRFLEREAFWELRLVSLSGQASSIARERLASDFAVRRGDYTSQPAWTASGAILFTSDAAGLPRPQLALPRGGAPRALLRSPGRGPGRPFTAALQGATYPALTRDGSLLFVAPDGNRTTIWRADPRTGAARVWARAG